MTDPKQLAARYLAPLSRAAQRRPCLYEEIAKEMSRRSGKRFVRQGVYRWLNPNVERREQPALGTGLLLVKVGSDLTKRPANQKV